MKERNNLFFATGIPSLFLIFAVLILVTLSLLGYGTSSQTLSSSTLSLEQNTAYYKSCGEAADFYTSAQEALSEFQEQANDETTFFLLAGSYFTQIKNVTWDADTHQVQYVQAFSDTQSLHAVFLVSLDNTRTSAPPQPLSILAWNTIVTADWDPDTSQSVYKGE